MRSCTNISPKTLGYTLVEISILLAAVGLLVGGIFTSRHLIHIHELRSVDAQQRQFAMATSLFRDRYKYLPGDMPNATSFWGIAAGATGNNALCGSRESTDKKTCNGNGDWKIAAPTTGGPEGTRFWQHLSNAELIEGQYSGAYSGGIGGRDKTNSPDSKITNTVWSVYYFGDLSGNTKFFDGSYGNILWLGEVGSTTLNPGNAVQSNQDLYELDTKYDDGKPATGVFVVYVNSGNFGDCTTDSGPIASASLTASYKLTDSSAMACQAVWRDLF